MEKFTKFTTEKMTLDEFFDYVRELAANSKLKIYNKVLDSEADVRLYYDIIQLSESNINMSNKMKIIGLMETPSNKLGKMKFHTMLIEDGMTNAIKNADMWLRDVTQKLDEFILQD